MAARVQSHREASQATQAFRAVSAQVAASVKLAIQRDQDLVVSTAAFVAGDPTAPNSRFVQWARRVQAIQRYPELLGLGDAVIVTPSRLRAFAAAARHDPAGALSAGGTFTVSPPGHRALYCFTQNYLSRGARNSYPAGFDWCDGPLRQPLLAARDSGASAYLPITIGTITALTVFTPVYRAAPGTRAARRAAFLGWVGLTVVPGFVLEPALAGHPGIAVRLVYRTATSAAAFRDGTVPASAQSQAIGLHNGWTVQTFHAAPPTGLLADGRSAGLLAGGITVSLLLGGLILVLGTGQARARRLVNVKTGELRHQALHDALTGLPNRVLVSDRVEQLLAHGHRSGTPGAVLFVDLDGFKNVNDTLGHAAGDRLLIAVADRLTSTLREVDTIGRMSGDEFVVLIDATHDITPAIVADRLLDALRQPFAIDATAAPVTISASIGIATGDRASAGILLRDADIALYAAKANGKNRHATFQPDMQTEISRRTTLELELRAAISDDQFGLVYQPIYRLDDLTIVGVEALLRWQHPTRGTIAPDQFLPSLEQTGEILTVGRWVLHTACAQTAAWHAQGNPLDVSVNLSARQLDNDAIIDHIRVALTTSGLPASALIVEVTETAVMRDPAAAAQRLSAIRQLGVRVAIDDFGTGFSSLSYLQHFPADCLKIDRSFTHSIASSPQSQALLKAVIQLGADLGLTTVAEGVETTAQIEHLRGEQVTEAQGFLLSRPLDAPSLEAHLLAPTRSAHPDDRSSPLTPTT